MSTNKDDKIGFEDDINSAFDKKGWAVGGWKVYGNKPEHPETVVANDLMGIVTQLYLSNYELEEWLKYPWYRPWQTHTEMVGLKEHTGKIGLWFISDQVSSMDTMQQLYKKYILPRLRMK